MNIMPKRFTTVAIPITMLSAALSACDVSSEDTAAPCNPPSSLSDTNSVQTTTTSTVTTSVTTGPTDFITSLDQIEGDVLPGTLPTWDDIDGMDAATIVNGDGTISITIDDTANASWGADSPALDSSVGWTFEMRVRVDDQLSESGAVFDVLNRDNTGEDISPWISIHAGGIGSRTSNWGRGVVWPVDLTTDFHTIRMSYDPTEGSFLWVDGQLITETVPSESFNSPSIIRIGRWSSGTDGGTFTLDYFRWHTAGDPTPN